jgi:uncharacterized UPF0160 family protein
MKKIVILLLILVGNNSFAQEEIPDIRHVKPDYTAIKEATQDVNSVYFYTKLMRKFKNGQQMDMEEKRHLYYGTIFQGGYNKDYTSDLLNDMQVILDKQNPTDEDFDNLLAYSQKILEENPFDLAALNYATWVYRKKGMDLQNQLAMIQFSSIVDAIFSSGDGITKKNAFHVIHNRDKAFIPRVIGYRATAAANFSDDYIPLKENKKGIQGFWYYIFN